MPDSPRSSRTDRPPTIVDVARAAGVSHSTVSRVLNGHPNIAADTRARVQAALDELGYVADIRARSLAGGRVGCVGLVVFDLSTSYLTQVVRSVDAALAEHGLDLMLCTTNRREQRERSYVQRLSGGMVDGVIVVIPTAAERYAAELAERRFPCVLLDHDRSAHASSVQSDNAAGVEMLVRHLADQGHERIGAIAGMAERLATVQRLVAFRQTVAALGLDQDPALVTPGSFEAPGGEAAAHRLFDLDRPPTAIIAGSDAAAIGAMRAAAERGISIPHDVSLTGFDDIPEAATTSPPLTTVRQPMAELGRRAVELLRERIDDPDRLPVHLTMPVELVVRASTAPPR